MVKLSVCGGLRATLQSISSCQPKTLMDSDFRRHFDVTRTRGVALNGNGGRRRDAEEYRDALLEQQALANEGELIIDLPTTLTPPVSGAPSLH